MRCLVLAVGLFTSSIASAQQEPPGGPKIFKELDAMTSTSATSSVATPPIERKLNVVPERRRGILGINVVNLGGAVRVKSMKPGGAAERAGVEKWDTILTIDGKTVADRRDYVRYMSAKDAGDSVIVEWRTADGSTRMKAITLDAGRPVVAEDDEDQQDDRGRRRRHVARRRPPKTRKWYGWQSLVADAPSLILMFIGLVADEPIVSGVGSVGYGIGAPMTHFFHDNVGRGMISMGLRVGVPALTVLGTIGICDEARVCSDSTPLVVIGGLITFIAIPVIDATALSWQKLEPDRQTSVNVSLAPSVVPTEGGATFGLEGTF